MPEFIYLLGLRHTFFFSLPLYTEEVYLFTLHMDNHAKGKQRKLANSDGGVMA